MNSIILMMHERLDDVYSETVRLDIAASTQLLAPPLSAETFIERLPQLAQVEVIFGGWGMPLLDEKTLEALPRLKAIFYAAGTVKSFTTKAVWERGIVISSAAAQNAIPVAEYCLGAILMSLKGVLRTVSQLDKSATVASWHKESSNFVPIGAYGVTIGLVSYGMIARLLRQHLRSFDLKVQVYCPFLSEVEAAQEAVELVTLDHLFATCDFVSIHTPELPETKAMIGRALLNQMKQGATLLNTARGSVIDQPALVQVFQERKDLIALLDVLEVEPPQMEDPVLSLSNILVTPHLAGSVGSERERMGRFALDEFLRYQNGSRLLGRIESEMLSAMA
jgi:phosphoglycerate dehydrogenase-like enzyme